MKQLHVGGINGTSAIFLQVMMTQLLQKHWEWQEGRRKNTWHGSERGPTMNVASMIEAAFDVARPKHTAKFVCDQKVLG